MNSTGFNPQSIAGYSVRDLVNHWAEQKPDEVFIIEPETGKTLTFGELRHRCFGLTAHLRLRGVPVGESVAYAMANGIDTASVIIGSLYGGYLTTAINLVSGKDTIGYVIGHADARIVFMHDKTPGNVAEAISEQSSAIEQVMIDASWFSSCNCDLEKLNCNQDGLLMYTSGTTGVPKGVVHTHASLLAGGCNTAMAHCLSGCDRGICVLPLYHINGLCVSLMGALVSGGSLVMPNWFSVSTFWDYLRAHQCSWFSVVPTQISYLLHEADSNGHNVFGLSSLRFGRSASAPLSPNVQKEFENRFGIPVIETMGLTETAAQILSNPIEGFRKIGSPGIPYGNEVIIGDARQHECKRGAEGEVLVRGTNVMRHYRNNPEATRNALTADGWLRTGDLGRMDEDGFVFITGRLKELIIKGGENIAPREIDEALYSHADVIEAAAFGRECSQYGQKVEAGVKIRDGSKITADELIHLCQGKIGDFKAPDQVHILHDLPKGPSGKIQRLKLEKMTR